MLQLGSDILPQYKQEPLRPRLTSSYTTAPLRPPGTGSSSSWPSTPPSWFRTTCPSRPNRIMSLGWFWTALWMSYSLWTSCSISHHVCRAWRGGDLGSEADQDELPEDLVRNRPAVLSALWHHQRFRKRGWGEKPSFLFVALYLIGTQSGMEMVKHLEKRVSSKMKY